MSQRVIVTGGAGGIGAAIVERFAADGAEVAVLDRRAPADRPNHFPEFLSFVGAPTCGETTNWIQITRCQRN